VASIPQSFQKQCIANTTAEYSFAEKGRIKVLNSCDTQEGKRSIVEGRAKIVDQTSNAKLKVTFVKRIKWVFPFGGKYWILEIGPIYSYAVVGDPTREYAWILSRTPSLNQQTLSGIESRLRQQGYDTSKILTSIQAKGFQKRIPLSDVVKQSLNIVDTGRDRIPGNEIQTALVAIEVIKNTNNIALIPDITANDYVKRGLIKKVVCSEVEMPLARVTFGVNSDKVNQKLYNAWTKLLIQKLKEN